MNEAAIEPQGHRGKYFIFLIGICGGALYWFIDMLVDVYFFGHGSIGEQMLHPSLQEVWIRCSRSA